MHLNIETESNREKYLLELRACDFGRIANTIQVLWGSRELQDYFQSLLVDNRGGRRGFPHDVFLAILDLYHLHDSEFDFSKPSPSVWDHIYRR